MKHINQHADEYGTAFRRIGQSENFETGPLSHPDAKRLTEQLARDGHNARALYVPDAPAVVTVER
jgi:hypothetical protein